MHLCEEGIAMRSEHIGEFRKGWGTWGTDLEGTKS